MWHRFIAQTNQKVYNNIICLFCCKFESIYETLGSLLQNSFSCYVIHYDGVVHITGVFSHEICTSQFTTLNKNIIIHIK